MFHDMAEEHGVEHPAFADDPRRLLLGQIAGVDVVALLAGDLGRDGVGLDADDLAYPARRRLSMRLPSLQPISMALPGSWRATAVVIRSSRCRGR